MIKYVSMIITKPNLGEEQQKDIRYKYMELINKTGKIENTENLGKKKLAYKIHNNNEGIYMEFKFKGNEKTVAELERVYRIDDNVMKFITIRVED